MTLKPPPQRPLGMICFALLHLSPWLQLELAGGWGGQGPGSLWGVGRDVGIAGAGRGSGCWGPHAPHWFLLAALPHPGPAGDAGLTALQPIQPSRELLPFFGMWVSFPAQWTIGDSKWHEESIRMVQGPSYGQVVSPHQPSPLTRCPMGCRGVL